MNGTMVPNISTQDNLVGVVQELELALLAHSAFWRRMLCLFH